MDMKTRVLGLLRGTDLLVGTRRRLAKEIEAAHKIELERALAEQREQIADAIESWKECNPCLLYDEAGWSKNAFNDAAEIARTFGQTEEGA